MTRWSVIFTPPTLLCLITVQGVGPTSTSTAHFLKTDSFFSVPKNIYIIYISHKNTVEHNLEPSMFFLHPCLSPSSMNRIYSVTFLLTLSKALKSHPHWSSVWADNIRYAQKKLPMKKLKMLTWSSMVPFDCQSSEAFRKLTSPLSAA